MNQHSEPESNRPHFFAQMRATLHAIFSDSAVVLIMIGAIVIYSFFYPMGYREQIAGQQAIAIVDTDQSSESRALIRHISAARAAKIKMITPNIHEAESAMRQGRLQAIVVIDPNLMKNLLRGEQALITLMGNGAYLGRANTVLLGIGDALKAYAQETAVARMQYGVLSTAPAVTLVQRPLFNTREGYGSAIVAGVAVLIVHQTLLIGMCVIAATRRQQLGIQAYPLKTLLAMGLTYWCVGFLGLLYYAGFTFWFHDYPLGGNLSGLLIFGALFVAAIVSFGLFLSSFFRTRERPYQIFLLTSLPLFFLSNLSWPSVASPEFLVAAAKLVPVVPGITGLVKLNQMGASLIDTQKEWVNMVWLIFIYGTLALWRFRPRANAT